MSDTTTAGAQLKIDVVLGSTTRTVAEIKELSGDSILELDTLVGEPVEVRAGDTVIARGDVVAIGDRMGVRLVEFPEQSRG